jgi:hypothetical protein
MFEFIARWFGRGYEKSLLRPTYMSREWRAVHGWVRK